jgi:hypothetical protein
MHAERAVLGLGAGGRPPSLPPGVVKQPTDDRLLGSVSV